MIALYSGTPGSGKSLHAAYRLIDWIRYRGNVIGNFPVNSNYFNRFPKFKRRKFGSFYYADNSALTVDSLRAYALSKHEPFKESQTLLIIDECASIFNSRNWSAPDRMKWIQFFQQHRKLGFDILLISQSDRLIDRQIRAFIETEYKHRCLKAYKVFGHILNTLTGGMFIALEYWYGPNLKCGSEIFFLNRRKAAIYDSFKIFTVGDGKAK